MSRLVSMLIPTVLIGFVANGQAQLHELVLQAEQSQQSAVHASDDSSPNPKCSFGLRSSIMYHGAEFSPEQLSKLASFLSPPSAQKSRVIGRFRVHYDTLDVDGTQEPPAMLDLSGNRIPNSWEEYVDSVGAIFNHVWEVETSGLGFDAPPLETGEIAYNVYVKNISDYGYTQPEELISGSQSPQRWTSWIGIDNDYRGFYSRGMNGLRVTAAHEFHHAIQVGSYGYRIEDIYFMELTSVWLEDVVYDAVNDYYQYLRGGISTPRGQFLYPGNAFTCFTNCASGTVAYSRVVWAKYIEQRFGRDKMRQIWDMIRQVQSIPAMDLALRGSGSSFRQAFLEWTVWNANTGPSADTIRFYQEGRAYPPIRTAARIEFTPPQRSVDAAVQPISSHYQPVLVRGDTMLACISNINLAKTYSVEDLSFEYHMQEQSETGFKQLSNGLYVKLNVPDPENWATQESVSNIVEDVVVFPNPVNVKGESRVRFRLPTASASTAMLHVFSASLDRVFARSITVEYALVGGAQSTEARLVWDLHSDRGDAVATGVYFFVIDVDNRQYSGKFAVVRE
jgi:hypothetical protein